MYKLELYDGTIITGLQKLNPVTFRLNYENNEIYYQLSDYSLQFALLYDEDDDDLLEGVFLDYTLQNFTCMGGITQFRIQSLEEIERLEKNRREKELKKKSKKRGYGK